MKAVAVLLQELCAVVLVICILLLTTLFDRSMLDLKDLKNKTFTESKYYETLFQDAVGEILDYMEYREQFETKSVYNPEKNVNIMAYEKSNAVGEQNVKLSMDESDKFSYYLIDLENWSKEYASVECLVESSLYLTKDEVLHQKQNIYIDGETVRESEQVVHTLGDMDQYLQELVVTNAQYYYGGYYNLEEYQNSNTVSSGTMAFFDRPDTAGNAPAANPSETDTSELMPAEDIPEGDAAAVPENGEMKQNGQGAERARAEQLKESIQKIIDGKLFELEGQELTGVLVDLKLLDLVTTNESQVLDEKYMAVGETTILKEFLSEAITLEEMQQAYESLEYTLHTIGQEITAYKRLVNKYEKGTSNLRYWIYHEGTNEYFTNISNEISLDSLVSYGKKLGGYFYYNKDDINLNTNVSGMEDAFYDDFENRAQGIDSVIFVGVDTEFPHEDSFFRARGEYNRLQPWGMVSLVAAVVSLCVSFLCFIYLSLAAGRHKEDEEIHLNWLDRIKTEIILAGFLGVCVVIIAVIQKMARLSQGSDVIGLMIMAGGMAFTANGVFMVFYMSFVRRIKAGIMWSGSLLYWSGIGIQKVIKNWKPSVRILVFFMGHVALTLFMAVIALRFRHGSGGQIVILAAYLLLCGVEALMFLREGVQRNAIMNGIRRIAGGDLEYEINTDELKGNNKFLGEAVNTISEGLHHAVDDSMKNERLKADLITNVSHDIKTPLTSIINYVDLLKREKLDNERVKGYIRVLDAKSQRLKQLTENLVEASKVSSGNITLQMDRLNFVELVYQTAGEFNEKFEARGLTAVTKLPQKPVVILADGRRIWRVIENLYNNVAKYAMENTRVYVDMEVLESVVALSIKNISEQPLNIEASELTERFIRGDVSRSTEGSGLGLSIAENLTRLMGGTFDIYLDGDLFKVTVTFPVVTGEDDVDKESGERKEGE